MHGGSTGFVAPSLSSWLHQPCYTWYRAVSKQELYTSHTPTVNSISGWRDFKITGFHSSAGYSWVPHSHCFTSSMSKLHLRLGTGWSSVPLQMHRVWMHPHWVQGVWSLLQWAQYISQNESHNMAVRMRPGLKPKKEKALGLMHLIWCYQGPIPSLFCNQQNHQRK